MSHLPPSRSPRWRYPSYRLLRSAVTVSLAVVLVALGSEPCFAQATAAFPSDEAEAPAPVPSKPSPRRGAPRSEVSDAKESAKEPSQGATQARSEDTSQQPASRESPQRPVPAEVPARVPGGAERPLAPRTPTALPHRLPYRSGDPVPAGYRVETQSNSGLLWAGALVLAGSYGGSLVYASSAGFDNGRSWLLVPVAGPWGAMLGRKTPCRDPANASTVDDINELGEDCARDLVEEAQAIAVLLLDGVVQAAGAGLLIGGLASSEQFLVYDGPEVQAVLAPTPLPGGYALTLSGMF